MYCALLCGKYLLDDMYDICIYRRVPQMQPGYAMEMFRKFLANEAF